MGETLKGATALGSEVEGADLRRVRGESASGETLRHSELTDDADTG